jgi:hypothetical protein
VNEIQSIVDESVMYYSHVENDPAKIDRFTVFLHGILNATDERFDTLVAEGKTAEEIEAIMLPKIKRVTYFDDIFEQRPSLTTFLGLSGSAASGEDDPGEDR